MQKDAPHSSVVSFLGGNMNIRIRIMLVIFILLPFSAFGQEQIPDEMLLNGGRHNVYGFRIREDMSNSLKANSENWACSANWDRYKATLLLKDNKLFIKKLDIGCEFLINPNYQTPDPKIVFGVSIPDSGLFAEWFSGNLSEYYGKAFIEHIKSHRRFFYFEKGILVRIEEKVTAGYEDYLKFLEKQKKE